MMTVMMKVALWVLYRKSISQEALETRRQIWNKIQIKVTGSVQRAEISQKIGLNRVAGQEGIETS
jgi:hypothetical protein